MIVAGGVVLLALVLARLWSRTLKEEIRVLCHESNQVWNQCKHAKVFTKGYKATSWFGIGSAFFSGSWHTVMHNVVRAAATYPTVKYDRRLFKLSDGGTVALDWALMSSFGDEVYESVDLTDERYPIVFIHHGLCGSSESHYMLKTVHDLLHQKRYRVVCLVARGCGGVPMTTPQGFTAARTDDMREALADLRSQHVAPIFGLGFSLGAGLMAKYVGEEGTKCVLSSACVVSPCWDYMDRSPWFHIWSAHFLAKSLVDYTKQNINIFLQCKKIKLDEALNAKYVADYDAAAIVPLHGYKDVDDYYQNCSPVTYAHNISIPTLAISADDDPVCSVKGCPKDINDFGEGLVILRTKRGGHVAWAEGFGGYDTWMDRAISTWMDASHEKHRLCELPGMNLCSEALSANQPTLCGSTVPGNCMPSEKETNENVESKGVTTDTSVEPSQSLDGMKHSSDRFKTIAMASAICYATYRFVLKKRIVI